MTESKSLEICFIFQRSLSSKLMNMNVNHFKVHWTSIRLPGTHFWIRHFCFNFSFLFLLLVRAPDRNSKIVWHQKKKLIWTRIRQRQMTTRNKWMSSTPTKFHFSIRSIEYHWLVMCSRFSFVYFYIEIAIVIKKWVRSFCSYETRDLFLLFSFPLPNQYLRRRLRLQMFKSNWDDCFLCAFYFVCLFKVWNYHDIKLKNISTR